MSGPISIWKHIRKLLNKQLSRNQSEQNELLTSKVDGYEQTIINLNDSLSCKQSEIDNLNKFYREEKEQNSTIYAKYLELKADKERRDANFSREKSSNSKRIEQLENLVDELKRNLDQETKKLNYQAGFNLIRGDEEKRNE